MEIITTKDAFGGELIYSRVGLVKGRNELKKMGYTIGANPLYMKKGNEYWHYNRTIGIWVYEKVKESKSTVFTGDF